SSDPRPTGVGPGTPAFLASFLLEAGGPRRFPRLWGAPSGAARAALQPLGRTVANSERRRTASTLEGSQPLEGRPMAAPRPGASLPKRFARSFGTCPGSVSGSEVREDGRRACLLGIDGGARVLLELLDRRGGGVHRLLVTVRLHGGLGTGVVRALGPRQGSIAPATEQTLRDGIGGAGEQIAAHVEALRFEARRAPQGGRAVRLERARHGARCARHVEATRGQRGEEGLV